MASRRRKIIKLIVDSLNSIEAGVTSTYNNVSYTYNHTLKNKVVRSSKVLNKLNNDIQAFVMDGTERRDFETHLRTHAPMNCSILLVGRISDDLTARKIVYKTLPDIQHALESTRSSWSTDRIVDLSLYMGEFHDDLRERKYTVRLDLNITYILDY